MKYFFDTEFVYDVDDDRDWSLELVSIGIVAEDGREYYAINPAGVGEANGFVRACVLPHLGNGAWRTEREIAADIRAFVTDNPEFWVYMGAFDYVLLSGLMGGFNRWPNGWPYLANDLRQLLDAMGHVGIRQPDDAPHNAIEDARWIAQTYAEVRT